MPSIARRACLLLAFAGCAGTSPRTDVDRGRAPSRYEVVHGWPQLPEGDSLGGVTGVGVDSHQHVVVFHRAERSWPVDDRMPTDPIEAATVLFFDADGGRLRQSWGAGTFVMPHGLRVDRHDNVWLTDVALHQVFQYSHDGKLLRVLGERGVPGSDSTHFNRPTDVSVLEDGSFYVADGYRNTQVMKFGPGVSCSSGERRVRGRGSSTRRTPSPSMPPAASTSPTAATHESRSSPPTDAS